MNPRVSLLGTGIMGAGMAERLLDQGFTVDVWNRTPAATTRLAERGATAHGQAADEAGATAHRLGVPYSALLAAVQGGPLASGTALARLAKMEKSDHSTQFPLEWALKDLDLTAAASGPDAIPVATAIADRWRRLVREGYGRLDVSAARLGLTSDAGVTVAR